MRKVSFLIILVILSLFCLSLPIMASEPTPPMPNISFPEGTRGMGWGGVGLGYLYPDFSELNDVLGADMKFETPVPIIVGGGEGGILPGFTVGGFGGGGTVREGNAQLDMGLGGFVFNRTLPLKSGHWSFGGLIGGGGATLVVKNPGTATTVEDAISTAQQTHMTAGFFTLGPRVGVQIPMTPFIQLQASAGYLFSFGGDWKLTGTGTLSGGKVNWGGTMLHIGFVFGGSEPLPRLLQEEDTQL